MLEKKKDGAYSVTEIKLSPKSRPSRGQKAVEKNIKNGNIKRQTIDEAYIRVKNLKSKFIN